MQENNNRLRISELWMYPVKSLGGMAMHEVQLLPKGFAFDRRWMLIDDQQQFMTQRTDARLSQFKLAFHDSGFAITHKGEQIILPLGLYESQAIEATIWNDTVEVHEVSAAHSQWFSRLLQKPCKLVYFPETHMRAVDPQYAKQQEQVSLADAFPMLMIGQSSLDDINGRLQVPVPMNRFRPSIVFTGGTAFEEDGWKLVEMGGSLFELAKPCARCVLTTVNQETGERGVEPLATLSQYRKVNNKVLFGQNVLPLQLKSHLKVGAEIIVKSIK